MRIVSYSFPKLGKMSQNLSSAAVVIGALRVNFLYIVYHGITDLLLNYPFLYSLVLCVSHSVKNQSIYATKPTHLSESQNYMGQHMRCCFILHCLAAKAQPVHFRFKGCWVAFFIFIQILIEHSVSKQWRHRSDTAVCVSDLTLKCLPMSHKKDARLIWVKEGNVLALLITNCIDAL